MVINGSGNGSEGCFIGMTVVVCPFLQYPSFHPAYNILFHGTRSFDDSLIKGALLGVVFKVLSRGLG